MALYFVELLKCTVVHFSSSLIQYNDLALSIATVLVPVSIQTFFPNSHWCYGILEESDEYWCFQNYELVHENYSMPPFPPPLNLLYVPLSYARLWHRSAISLRRHQAQSYGVGAGSVESANGNIPKPDPMHTLKPGTTYCRFRTLNPECTVLLN